ncbi:MFS transporter [Paenibacillus melissococcoides]|uniref:MFS transporter n=1 Tax=Paenibacillus melissococcoides TaxID=2912268 RepID=A0ABN8U0A8_9BACL|nr:MULTISPECIES: MFS transporter [Paenibacillus]MEB9894726.1 MFS transporter [Bacillus cereus]CAH8244482.1 MFS transporter [Paenibacillus melissococcoides]CAH8708118.1 MFS transporter [Paenibacillus melissococcoides]CAH8708824.1 MFS transporter [Paenibacillus melissococcoides]
MKYLFAAIMFTISIDIFIMSPLLPTLRMEFGIGADTSGWLMSAYSLGYAVTAMIAGPLTERMNRKKVLIAGLAAFAACTALCGTANGFDTMFLFRFLAGVAAAITTPQVWASIPQTVAGPAGAQDDGLGDGRGGHSRRAVCPVRRVPERRSDGIDRHVSGTRPVLPKRPVRIGSLRTSIRRG